MKYIWQKCHRVYNNKVRIKLGYALCLALSLSLKFVGLQEIGENFSSAECTGVSSDTLLLSGYLGR
jgi:hypothetical protein